MDVHDVSDLPQHFEMLRAQQRTLDQAQARKGQSPFPLPPPMLLIAQFTIRLMAETAATATTTQASPPNQTTLTWKSSHAPAPYLPCTQPLAALNKITIRDLVLEIQHRGTFLLVRTVTPPDQLTGLMAIVQDEAGDAIMLQLYHQQDGLHSSATARETLPQGQVLILKEPYLKMMANGEPGLRADHISDVIFLSPGSDDARIPGSWRQLQVAQQHERPAALAWKTEGNEHFRNSRFLSAIACYTKALGCCSPTTVQEAQTIKLNRALAYIKTKRFDAALSDVELVVSGGHNLNETQPPPEKGLFRKAEALYHLRRYRECCEALKVLRLAYPNNADARALLNRGISRLAEETHGRYSFRQLHDESAALRPPHLDHATFIGPVVVRQAGGSRGRGLFTTKKVKAGDLLFCEKAFTHAFFYDKDGSGGGTSDLTILYEPGGRVTMGTQADLINMTIRKLYHNPSLMPIINDLYHGSYQPVETREVDGQPVVDSFLVRRIISLNCFGCPALSTLDDFLCHQKKLRCGQLESRDREDSPWHSTGIWPMASYINHSCISNARRSFVGDMMIARATRDLEPDTEITWWYYPPDLKMMGSSTSNKSKPQRASDSRNTKFAHWGFTCDCPLCREEGEKLTDTPATSLQKRRTLLAGLEKYLSSSLSNGSARSRSRLDTLKKTRTFVRAMQATYASPATDLPRLALWWGIQKGLSNIMPSLAVSSSSADHHRAHQDMEELLLTAELIMEGLSSLGYVVEGGISVSSNMNPVPVVGSASTGRRFEVKEWGLLLDGVVDCWSFLRDVYRLLLAGADDQMVAEVEEYAKTAYRMVFGEDESFARYGEV